MINFIYLIDISLIIGHGSMGISNSIGSNTFDILLCLGLPWLIKASLTPTEPGLHRVSFFLYPINYQLRDNFICAKMRNKNNNQPGEVLRKLMSLKYIKVVGSNTMEVALMWFKVKRACIAR